MEQAKTWDALLAENSYQFCRDEAFLQDLTRQVQSLNLETKDEGLVLESFAMRYKVRGHFRTHTNRAKSERDFSTNPLFKSFLRTLIQHRLTTYEVVLNQHTTYIVCTSLATGVSNITSFACSLAFVSFFVSPLLGRFFLKETHFLSFLLYCRSSLECTWGSGHQACVHSHTQRKRRLPSGSDIGDCLCVP